MSNVSSRRETSVRAARVAAPKVIPVWAVGERRALSDEEWRLTAAVLAEVPGVLDHVRRAGSLPQVLPGGGRELGLLRVVLERGLRPVLTDAEREVLEALDVGGEAPIERAVLLDDRAL